MNINPIPGYQNISPSHQSNSRKVGDYLVMAFSPSESNKLDKSNPADIKPFHDNPIQSMNLINIDDKSIPE